MSLAQKAFARIRAAISFQLRGSINVLANTAPLML